MALDDWDAQVEEIWGRNVRYWIHKYQTPNSKVGRQSWEFYYYSDMLEWDKHPPSKLYDEIKWLSGATKDRNMLPEEHVAYNIMLAQLVLWQDKRQFIHTQRHKRTVQSNADYVEELWRHITM